MTGALTFARDRAGVEAIAAHLRRCDATFVPPLSGNVDLDAYAMKIATHAARFEAWAGADLAGLVAAYCNATDRVAAFVTNVSVLPATHGRGVASQLMRDCIAHARAMGFRHLDLEVDRANDAAAGLYQGLGFTDVGVRGRARLLRLAL